MKHVIRIEGPYPVDVIVETIRSAVRLTLEYPGWYTSETLLLTPAETAELAVALQAAVRHHIGARCEDEVP